MQLNSCLEAAGIKLGAEIVDIIFSFCHKNYRIKTHDGQHYMVKIFVEDLSSHDSRMREMQLLRVAAQYDLTPELIYIDPEYRFVISKWIEVVPYRAGSHHQTLMVKALARMKKIEPHIQLEPVDNAEQLMFYVNALSAEPSMHQVTLERVTAMGMNAIKQLESFDLEEGLCHMDLSTENILLQDDHCYLIDFEYAQFNYKIFDWVSLMYLDKGPVPLRTIETLFEVPDRDAIHWAHVYLLCLSWLWFHLVYTRRKEEHYLKQAHIIYDQLMRLD